MHGYYCPVRYGLCFLSIATLAAMRLIGDLFFSPSGPERNASRGRWVWLSRVGFRTLGLLVSLVIAGAIVVQLVWAGQRLPIDWIFDLLISSELIVIGFIGVLLNATWPRLLRWLSLVFLLVALPVFAWASAILSHAWHREFPHFYEKMDGFIGLQEVQQKKAGPKRILVLQPLCYAYFGSQRQHHVYQPVYVYSPEWLMELLAQEKVNFVVATSVKPSVNIRGFEGFEKCRVRHPNRFRIVKENAGDLMVEVVQRSEQSRAITGEDE